MSSQRSSLIWLCVVAWVAPGIWSAGVFRAMARHDWPLSEQDPVYAHSDATRPLVLGIAFGPFGIFPAVMITGFGSYGWENPFSNCYWDVHPYGAPCKG